MTLPSISSLPERWQVPAKVAVLLTAVLIIGFGIYWLFFSGSTPSLVVDEPGATNQPGSGTGLPGAGDGGDRTPANSGSGRLEPSNVAKGGLTAVKKLTESSVVSAISNGSDVSYFDPADGRFYTLDGSGNVKRLSEEQFVGASAVEFSNGAQKALIEFPDGSNIVYDFERAKQVNLPDHWDEFSFSADGEELVAKSLGSDPSNRSLVITAVDGSKTEVIADLGLNANKVDVSMSPSGQVVGFSHTGEGGAVFGQQKVYLIGIDGEASGVLIVDGENFIPNWSPNGSNFIYSVADPGNDYRAVLWYADSLGDRKGKPRVKLPISTLADKCVFKDESHLICAVPSSMPAGGGNGGSFLVGLNDYLYEINLNNFDSSLLAIPDGGDQMNNLSLAEDGRLLYYIDSEGILKSIRLK